VRLLRDELKMQRNTIAKRIGVAPTTAMYLYGCHANRGELAYGVRRALIATLELAGPRVTELCQLDNQDVDLSNARFHIRDSKTETGIRAVGIHPRLWTELTNTRAAAARSQWTPPPFRRRQGGDATRTTSAAE
jgi:integrase